MTKSLESFPTKTVGFNKDRYGHDIRTQVGAVSPYVGEVGLEFELEGRGLGVVQTPEFDGATWVPHNDGSLRNGGMEYVLSRPINRAFVRPASEGLFNALRASGARISNSTRCSTHVHINATGMRLNQLCSFVALWGCVEDVLANWCGASRSGNLFALRLSDCDFAVEAWRNGFVRGNFMFARDYRYLALNPACLATFGSLEVRTMRGVDNADDVVKWVEALMRIRDRAMSADYANPETIARDYSAFGPEGFAENLFAGCAILPELREATAVLEENFEGLIRRGFRRIQPIIHSLEWGSICDELSKPFVPDPFAQPVRRARPPRFNEDVAHLAEELMTAREQREVARIREL